MTSHASKDLKPQLVPFSLTLDPLAISIDAISILSLCLVVVVGRKAIRTFRESRRAVVESASLLTVIVDALTSRIQRSESALTTISSDVLAETRRSDMLQTEQNKLHTGYEEIARQLHEMVSNDKKLIADLEQIKTKLKEIPQRQPQQSVDGLPRRENVGSVLSEGDILSVLTETERSTLQILMDEGPKGAPELGKRLKKSREHTSRLMKKLYMEGYVNRESNYSPFRYKLNDQIRSALASSDNRLKAERPELP